MDLLFWYELIIIVCVVKDVYVFVIDVDFYNEKKNILVLGW